MQAVLITPFQIDAGWNVTASGRCERRSSDRCQILFIRPPLLMFVRLLAALITKILYSFWYLVLCRSLQQTWRAKGKNVDLK
jgi:hypothetical protein